MVSCLGIRTFGLETANLLQMSYQDKPTQSIYIYFLKSYFNVELGYIFYEQLGPWATQHSQFLPC
jgi:hypothetical protein